MTRVAEEEVMRRISILAVGAACVALGCTTGGSGWDRGEARVAAPERGAAVTARAERSSPQTGYEHEHPNEPRRAEDERHAFRSTGRPAADRVARAPTFQPGAPPPASVFYGLAHSHTLYSDGLGTPAEAFQRARSVGLDFMSVTSHNHDRAEMGATGARRDGVLIADDHALYESDSPVSFTRFEGTPDADPGTSASVIGAAEAATADGTFVAMAGQEFSSISSGNHLNVIGIDEVITVPNGDFATLYSQLAGADPPIVQMNHPHIHKDLFYRGQQQRVLNAMFNDYGFDDFGEDFCTLVTAADPLIVLIEVLSGPAMDDEIHTSFHYPSRLVHDEDYYYYLIQGFHISPSVGQDNHFRTWGDSTPARMGVFAPELTETALVTGMRANRTFATEDPDLRVELAVNGEPMGGVLDLDPDAPLDITVEVSDPTEPNSSYVVELFYGDVAPQDRASLVKFIPDDGFTDSFSFSGDGVLTFDEFLASGSPEFFFVRLQQGDGDRAWSAPVWINHPRPGGGS